MGLFSFIKDAGEKLFGGKDAHAASAPAAAGGAAAASQTDLNAKAAQAIEKYVNSQNLGASGVDISYDGGAGKVTVKGEAPTQAIKEKITLCCGNVANVTSVDNQMDVTNRARSAVPRRGERRQPFGHCQEILWRCQQVPANL